MKEWNPKTFSAYCQQVSENTEDKTLRLLRGDVVRSLYETIEAIARVAPEWAGPEPIDVFHALDAQDYIVDSIIEWVAEIDEEQREKLFPYISRLIATGLEESAGMKFSSMPRFVRKPMILALNKKVREQMNLPPAGAK
tara:strand:- start:2159 stop:2575 length:417 start_codon:yes stop_codon:yes gene_type:complete